VATSAGRAAAIQPEPDLEDFFDNGNVGLHLVGRDGTILKANPADYVPLGYAADEYVGRNIADFHADRDVIDDILARLTRGERLERYPARLKAKDGSIRDVEISSSVRFEDGEFVNTRCFTVDVTDQRRVEAALRAAEEKLAATFESAVASIAEVDAQGGFLRVNEAFCALTGHSREEMTARSFFDFTHPADLADERERWRALVAGEVERFTIEKRYVRRDGRIIWVEVMNSAVRGADGRFAYGVKMLHDVTERKEAESRQRLLLDELNHRVKNTLATVQSLAAQTARGCDSVGEFRARFEPRLLALSAAHDRLTRNQWEGASLRAIAEEELAAHAAPGRTLHAEGTRRAPVAARQPVAEPRPARTGDQRRQAWGPVGPRRPRRSRLEGRRQPRPCRGDDGVARARRPVGRPTGPRGLRLAPAPRDGAGARRDDDAGVLRRGLRLDPHLPAGGAGRPMTDLAGKRILVVEDEALVAMMLEDLLADLGCEVVGPAMRLDEGLALARLNGLDAAVLDINLGGERSYPIADLLDARGVPIAFVTGYGHSGRPGRSDRVLQKPYREPQLRALLAEMLASA